MENEYRKMGVGNFPAFLVSSFLDIFFLFWAIIGPYNIWESVYSLRGSVSRPHLIWVMPA